MKLEVATGVTAGVGKRGHVGPGRISRSILRLGYRRSRKLSSQIEAGPGVTGAHFVPGE